MRGRLLALVAALLLLPALSFAADGDRTVRTTQREQYSDFYVLCETKDTSHSTASCTQMNIPKPGDTYIFSILDASGGDCTYSIMPHSRPIASGTIHEVGTALTNSNTKVTVYGPMDEYIGAVLTSITGASCDGNPVTKTVSVYLEILYDE